MTGTPAPSPSPYPAPAAGLLRAPPGATSPLTAPSPEPTGPNRRLVRGEVMERQPFGRA